MPRAARFAIATLATLWFAAEFAHAGALASATWVESVLGVSIEVPVLATGTSTATSVSVSLELPEFQFETFTSIPFVSIAGTRVRLEAGGSALLSANASMAAAAKGLPASARVLVQTSPAAPIYDIYRVRFAPGALRLPPAAPTQSFLVFYEKAYVYAGSYGFTPGAVTLTGLTASFMALPDAKAQGSFALTALGAGTVTLVAPRRIHVEVTNPSLPFAQRTVGSFTTLTLHFVPEPRASLLLAAAGAALLLRGRRRR